jgi:cob(I)alamin adenosyltransferase
MTDGVTNLSLDVLRRIEERMPAMAQKLDRVANDLHDVKLRLTALDDDLVVVHQRLGRLDHRLDRVEQALDQIETPH